MEKDIMICEAKNAHGEWERTFYTSTIEEVYQNLAEDLLQKRYNKNSGLYRITRRKEPQIDGWKITSYYRDDNGRRFRYIYYVTFE